MVVENIYDSGGRYLAYAYPGATQPALVNYAPLVLKRWPTLNANWKQTTDLLLFNPNTQDASVTVTIYDSWGSDSGSASKSYTVLAGRRILVSAVQFSDVWDYGGFLASARIESSQPLAVTTRNLVGLADGAGNITTPYLAGSYLAESRPTNFFYASTTAREYYGYDSSLQVQNASGSNTTFRIKYYPLNSGTPTLTLDTTVSAYRSANFWRPTGMSAGFFGSATVEVVSGGPLAVMAQYDRFDTANSRYGVTQYEGVSALNSSLGMAHIQKASPWTYTGIQAQNMNNSAANIQLYYFNTDGTSTTPASSVTKSNVPANAAVNFWWTTGSPPEIPGGLNGSGLGGASNLALMVSFDRMGGDPTWQNKDGMMGYAAVK